MIRKNDSLTYIKKWKKTITPKINWHISLNSIYGYKDNKKNWNYRVGIHYTDDTNKYQKVLISKYKVLKEINRIIKKHENISGTLWSNKIVLNNYNDFKKIIHMAENIAKKYGFIIIRNKYENHFPYIEIKRIRNYYIYPFYI